MMRAGKLDRRIRIERYTTTTNDFGEAVPAWAALATVWAEAEQIRDGERFAAGEVAAERTHRFRIRWSGKVDDLTPKDRVVYPAEDGRTYNVISVKEIGRREGLEITAAARAD